MKRRTSLFLHSALLAAGRPLVGGQAVLEGVMMRNAEVYGLALRRGGEISAERRRWAVFLPSWVRKIRFVRGFPILMETLINGIRTLNRSAELLGEADEKPVEGWHLALTLAVALVFAVLLGVVLPHGITWLLSLAGLSGDVSGVSFQLWDGLVKLVILAAYIMAIGRLPEIHRVFQYHGAEHKTIHAFETGEPVTLELAAAQSRLHPRCGTTFLLFVVCVSVLLHTVLVPALLWLWTPESALVRHAGTLLFKIFLIAPVAACSYELIHAVARMKDGPLASLLRVPGLTLQRLTTAEPEREHLEVALVALREALGEGSPYTVVTAPYSRSL